VKKASQRTCIGCFKKRKKEKLARLMVKKNQVVLDPSGRAPGRGAYLCQSAKGLKKECLEKAAEKQAFKRTFKKDLEIGSLFKKHGQEKRKKTRQKRKTSSPATGGGGLRPC
jgi:predicted RNA-binding protein YlxR (DUF448 family)